MLEMNHTQQDLLRHLRKIAPSFSSEFTNKPTFCRPTMLVGLENHLKATLSLGREYSPIPLPLPGSLTVEPSKPTSHLLSTENMGQGTSSSQGIAVTAGDAKSWLNICCKDHETCTKFRVIGGHESKKIVPTRLIDVGNDEDGQPAGLHIVSEDDGNDIEYLALSYAWGPVTHFLKPLSQTSKI